MPIHDWTRLEDGDFHHFHHRWIAAIADALNGGGLPSGYMALAEQVTGRPVPNVVALQTRHPHRDRGGVAVQSAPPNARTMAKIARSIYARRKDRVVIRHGRGEVVAIIELVSPGNKNGRHAFRNFVETAADIIDQGVNLLVVDLFPPTPRDPVGVHKAIWDQFEEQPYDLPPGQLLTVASYLGGEMPEAYVEAVGVGDELPSLPLFLESRDYVPAPLEATYMQAWAVFPAMLKELMAAPAAAS